MHRTIDHSAAGKRPLARVHIGVVYLLPLLMAGLAVTPASATVDFIEHVPANAVYGEAGGVTMREPLDPASGQSVDQWVRIGYSFYYTDIAVYYTTDGSTPQGAFGTPTGTTSVLTSDGGQLSFVRNEPSSPANIDWWRGTLPAGLITPGTTIKYKLSAWHDGGGPEIFANNYGCSDGTCDDPAAPATVFSFAIVGGGTLPWPGKGAPYADHGVGYPPVYFWKEEGVTGNHYMNVMLDQNGAVYDVYYPSAGCVHGVGTKNEGYVDGLDTFPPGLPAGYRGQMNINQAMAGIRVGGVTYWFSNESAAGYDQVTQQYVPQTNVISGGQRLYAGGNDIAVAYRAFCPRGITFPLDGGGNANRGLYVQQYVVTNHNAGATTIQFYYYADCALNGGDGYDVMFDDLARGALVAYDNTDRWTSASGEYNPTTVGDYHKDVSLYLAAALKLCDTVGGASGTPASDTWRQHGSADNGQGWIGLELTLAPGQTKEIDLLVAGGFDDFAGATGTYDYFLAPALDWFHATSVDQLRQITENDWAQWLADGVTIDTPDDRYDELFERGLLATALHLDGKNGGVIAGMHNGAYPFVWPRDAVWAAVTLDRTGHTAESAEVYRFLRDIAYRANDSWGQGFWYQKYTTDGHIVWSAPQVDETAVVPWGAYYHYRVTGDAGFLSSYYTMIYDAARASSEDSSIDSRLYYDDTYQLMHSNNLWEDAWDVFVYSNANVERGLRDAAAIADVLGHGSDAALFTGRANAIHSGLTARLAWDGENTDISQLGVAYPFEVYSPTDPLVAHLVDRMNGVATDTFGQNHPLMNFSGEWQGLVNRYWGDTYWNGGPWFLTTLWYGCYYAQRQDLTAGTGDIDNHLDRLELLLDRLGPIGLGAEQVAPAGSLLYPGESDFLLQAAWPNAWESMSFLVDALMLFLGYTPDAPGNTLHLEPKLPGDWASMTFQNVPVGGHRVDVTIAGDGTTFTHLFTNVTGNALAYETYVRADAGCLALDVRQNGTPIAYTYDAATGRVRVAGNLSTGSGTTTVVEVAYTAPGDLDADCDVDSSDLLLFANCMNGPALPPPGGCAAADLDGDGDVDLTDAAWMQRQVTGEAP